MSAGLNDSRKCTAVENRWLRELLGRHPYDMEEPQRGIRAVHSESGSTITVYQAYPPDIGLPAAREGRFPAVWKRDRMTWIKPRS